MERSHYTLQGLSRAIYESLLAAASTLASEGEGWDAALLEQVEDDLRRRLAPRDDTAARHVFDMVFRRSFAEARSLLVEADPLPGKEVSVLRQATA